MDHEKLAKGKELNEKMYKLSMHMERLKNIESFNVSVCKRNDTSYNVPIPVEAKDVILTVLNGFYKKELERLEKQFAEL